MKLGGGLLLLGRIVVIWFRWANSERSDMPHTDRHEPTGT